MKNIISLFFLIVLLLNVSGCSNNSDVEEIYRTSNLDFAMDAITVLKNTDATVATPTEVYILPKGNKVDGDPIFRADKVKNLKINWNKSVLEIHADEARVFLYESSVEVESLGKLHQIEIHLDVKNKL